MKFDYPPGATPIDLDEADSLLLAHITTRPELDRWERDNIKDPVKGTMHLLNFSDRKEQNLLRIVLDNLGKGIS